MDKQKSSNLNGSEIYKLHKTSFKRKQQADWYEPVIDYYIEKAESLNDKVLTEEALDAAKGKISDDMMAEVLKQVSEKGKDSLSAGDLNLLDDVDIITPIRDRYMGDFVKTPSFYTATVEGEDITLALKHKTQQKLFDVFVQQLKATLNKIVAEERAKLKEQGGQVDESGVETGTSDEEILSSIDIGKEAKRIKSEYFAEEAAKSKNLVEFFVKEIRLNEAMLQLFYYFFATDEVYVRFNPTSNDLGFEIIHPREYYRIKNKNTPFVEDDEEGMIKRFTSIKEILDNHSHKLYKEDIEYLESLLAGTPTTGPVMASTGMILSREIEHSTLYNRAQANLGTNAEAVFADDANKVEECLVYFTTKRKVGTLTYRTSLGEETTRRVGETYSIQPEYGDISLTWDWEDEVWECIRWGASHGIGVYTKPEPITVQRSELGKRNTCKIPIIGLQGTLHDYGRKPIPLRMVSHQALYIVLTNKYRREMAKFQGYVNLLAESILADSEEFTQSERLRLMYQDNLLVINDAEVDANTMQSLRTIGNSGQSDYIKVIAEMRAGTKAEAWDLANMNDQRYGNIDVRGGKGNNEEAIRRVSTGSVLMFTMFDMFRERLYQGMSDYGRLCYTNGVNKEITNGEGEAIELNLTHEQLISQDLGIHFTTSIIEKEKVDMIRNAIVSSNIQNGNTVDAIGAIKEDDLESLKKLAVKLQDAKDAREERMAQQQQETAKYIEDKKNELEDKKLQGNLDVTELKGKYDLLAKDKDIYKKVLELKAEEQLAIMGHDSNGNGQVDNYEGKSQYDDDLAYLELEIKRGQKELQEGQKKLQEEKIKTEKRKAITDNKSTKN